MNQYVVSERFRSIEVIGRLFNCPRYPISSKDLKIYQTGGATKTEKHTYFDKDGIHTFTVILRQDANNIYISIVNKDELDCATILIEKKDNIAILHNMSYYDNCTKEGLKSPGGGSILLRFVINFLIQHKDEYRTKRILLTDNSFFNCLRCSKNVSLARLRNITHGETWYMSYGFKPYDTKHNKQSIRLLKALDNNNKILDKLTTNECDVISVAKDMNKEEKYHKIDINELMVLVAKHKMFRDFFIRISKEYKKYCCLIRAILSELYETNSDDPEDVSVLTDFYGDDFYLDI